MVKLPENNRAALRVHIAQARNYLESYNSEVGILLNSGAASLEVHRLTNRKYKPALSETPDYDVNPINSMNPIHD